MSQDLIFYTNPMSRGRIVRWMLEEVGCPYTAEIVDYGPTMRSPEFLALSPLGKVPAIRHGDQVVTECAAICAYLADAFPDAGLAPPPAQRGAYYRALFFGAGPLEQAATNHAMGFEPEGDRQQGTVGYGTYARMLDALQKIVPAEGYVTGKNFSAADVYLGAHISWGLQFGSLEDRPGFADYAARCGDRPAHHRATELDDALVPAESAAG
ncbi:MAG: glutathione S-transferase family protein [Kiloniellaceae bacterium]